MTTETEKLDYVFNEITKEEKPIHEEKKWVCDSEICKNKLVHGIEHHLPDGEDDIKLGEVVCAECGNLLWED